MRKSEKLGFNGRGAGVLVARFYGEDGSTGVKLECYGAQGQRDKQARSKAVEILRAEGFEIDEAGFIKL